jgi:acyl-CoA synthetase (AMP-forming)/AMP-acid ligase II
MLHHLLRASALVHTNKTAVVAGETRLSYARLQAEALRLAGALRAAGAVAGDRVAIMIANSAEAAVSAWAILEAGCVLVPLHAGSRKAALQSVLEDCEPHWIVSSAELSGVLGSIAPARASPARIFLWTSGSASIIRMPLDRVVQWSLNDEPASNGVSEGPIGGTLESLAALIYTSGSTGEPKGVMLTHLNMRAAVRAVNAYLQWESSDVIYSPLPLSSSYGLYQLLSGLAVGATVVLDRSFAFPLRSLSLIASEKATVFAGVPTMYAWLASASAVEGHDLRALRILTSAAAALPIEHARRIHALLPRARLFVMYGQTECKRISYLDPEDLDRKPGSVGRGIPFQQHMIVDECGIAVASGEIGELIVSGPHVMQGYWRKPEQSERKLRPIPGSTARWLHTDDLFRMDADGYLYFMGRRDDLLKIGGHKVSPREVEEVLCQIPQVIEAAVIGAADSTWGQVVRAFLVCGAGETVSTEDVVRFCSSRLPGYMVPRSVVLVSELPKTESGKVRKRDLAPS